MATLHCKDSGCHCRHRISCCQRFLAAMPDKRLFSRQALVTDIVPDSKVRAAMNDINASQRLRCRRPTV